MPTKKELEEQMEELYQLYDEIRQKVHSLEQEVKTMRENEKNIVDEQIAINRYLNKVAPEQSEPDKTLYNVSDRGKDMWVNGDELNHAVQQGEIDIATYNRIITQSKRKEPDYFKVEPQYLQVGDQWRDEEGNEYVLAATNFINGHVVSLVNKNTGESKGIFEDGTSTGYIKNDKTTKINLGITDNMVKIK